MNIRDISIATMICLGLILGTGIKSYAEPKISPTLKDKIEKHIEKVKRTTPEKYEAMVQEAGGKITGCRSCHVKVGKEKNRGRQKENI